MQTRLIDEQPFDPEAAFPTAQLVAAMRAVDAASAKPQIGTNIGAGPDVMASKLAGELGKKFLADYAAAYSTSTEKLSEGLVRRTLFFDNLIMDAVADGIKQIVLLAAGLDMRAFRLPLSEGVTVFEVDVPAAVTHKTGVLTAAGGSGLMQKPKEADLSLTNWPDKLRAAGFESTERSFFLIEGLSMYLPAGAPEALLRTVKGLMQADRCHVAGDFFCNMFRQPHTEAGIKVIEKYGSRWTFETASPAETAELLRFAGYKDVRLWNVKPKLGKNMETGYSTSEIVPITTCEEWGMKYGTPVFWCCLCCLCPCLDFWNNCMLPRQAVKSICLGPSYYILFEADN